MQSVELLPDASGFVARLIEAAAIVSARAGDRIVLIGGLAVACRLGSMHRVTQDVDAVTGSDPDGPDLLEVLIAEGIGEPAGATRIVVGDVKVELIKTEPLPDTLSGISDEQRLFLLAHRWGFTSASPMVIRVAGTQVSVSSLVASRASLIAMKLHAAIDRTGDAKRASDIYDIYRLLRENEDRALTRSFESAPHDLADLVKAAVSRFFNEEAERSARWLYVHGDPGLQAISAQDLRAVGAPFVHSLSLLEK